MINCHAMGLGATEKFPASETASIFCNAGAGTI